MIYRSIVQQILSGVNRHNPNLPVKLTPDNVRITAPQTQVSTSTYNTRATIIPHPEFTGQPKFEGSVNVFYNRLPLNTYLKGLVVPGRYSDYTTSRDVIGALVDKYRLPLIREDVNLLLVEDVETITLTAAFSSVGFFGNVTLPYERI